MCCFVLKPHRLKVMPGKKKPGGAGNTDRADLLDKGNGVGTTFTDTVISYVQPPVKAENARTVSARGIRLISLGKNNAARRRDKF